MEIDDETLRRSPLPLHAGDGDKEDRGRVLIVAGSRQIPGAAVLTATAALRAGAGKVTIATPESIAQSVAFAVPESRVIALDETQDGRIAASAIGALEPSAERANALLIGPGLSDDAETCELTAALLALCSKIGIILDAGAMGVTRKPPNGIRFSGRVLLTPHAGEMAHLSGDDKRAIAADPQAAALNAARAWNAVVALKGAITYIAAPDGRLWRHEGGNVGLATSGSGDVLSGIIAGLVARGTPLEEASMWGVALHARAGARLAERLGPLGYLAREIPDEVPSLMAALAV
ncbi:MAG: NAD(P)H-hydrate dehydratase [Burkholderiales bacterium]